MSSSIPQSLMIRPLRQYEPIWIALKDRGYCRISAPVPLHPRIKKAVIKEKYNDVAWKLTLSDEQHKSAALTFEFKGPEIIFRLKYKDQPFYDLDKDLIWL